MSNEEQKCKASRMKFQDAINHFTLCKIDKTKCYPCFELWEHWKLKCGCVKNE